MKRPWDSKAIRILAGFGFVCKCRYCDHPAVVDVTGKYGNGTSHHICCNDHVIEAMQAKNEWIMQMEEWFGPDSSSAP